jgi:hypothetical protein
MYFYKVLGLLFTPLVVMNGAPVADGGLELVNVTMPHPPYNMTGT